MAENKQPNLFQRLTRLFRSGPVVKRSVLKAAEGNKTSTAFETFRKNTFNLIPHTHL